MGVDTELREHSEGRDLETIVRIWKDGGWIAGAEHCAIVSDWRTVPDQGLGGVAEHPVRSGHHIFGDRPGRRLSEL